MLGGPSAICQHGADINSRNFICIRKYVCLDCLDLSVLAVVFTAVSCIGQRTYQLFRKLGLRFLPVVNKYNQVVGTITRSDLTPDALAETMLNKGKKHV